MKPLRTKALHIPEDVSCFCGAGGAGDGSVLGEGGKVGDVDALLSARRGALGVCPLRFILLDSYLCGSNMVVSDTVSWFSFNG